MQIEITQEHIDSGVPNHCRLCALGIAIDPILPDNKIVFIDENKITIMIGEEGDRKVYNCSTQLKDWITRFDLDKRAVSPISIELKEGQARIINGR